jgi:cytoskeletal protein CcmA (bactofilin family)
MAINQLSTANTFQEWLTTTSTIVAVANNLTDGLNGSPFIINSQVFFQGANSSLNVRNSGAINSLYANTANISNVSFATSNIYLTANGSLIGGNIAMANVTSNLTVGGDAYIAGNLVVSGNVTLDAIGFDEIIIAGGASIGTVLNVAQGATITGDIVALSNIVTANISTTLNVASSITAKSANIANISLLNNNLSVPGNLTVTGTSSNITGRLFVGGNIAVANVTSNAYIGGDTFIYGNLTISGNTTLSTGGFDDLNVGGRIYVGTNLDVSGNANVVSNISAGNVNVTGKIAGVTQITGPANNAIYTTISAAIDSSIAFAIALGG